MATNEIAGRATPTILVVDDETELVEVLQMLLRLAGFRAMGVTSGQDCLNLLQTQSPDLILLDIMMPGLTGWDVLSAIQRDPQSQGVPVAFLSALGTKDDILRGLEAGAVAYFVKPIDLDAMIEELHWLTQGSRPERDERRQRLIGKLRG